MKNSLNDAKEELKRCDHLLYVSLKYTRTTDVIKSLVERIISFYDNIMDTLIKKKKKEAPVQKGLKVAILNEAYPNDELIKEHIKRYELLRKLIRSQYAKENEYRRHVGMVIELDGETYHINIDMMTEYFLKLKEFLEYLEEHVL